MPGSLNYSSSNHLAIFLDKDNDDSTKFSSSGDSLEGSLENTLKKLTPKTIYELKGVQIYDITKTKSHIAMVDSDYKLHIYKINNSFEEFEEMEFWEIYNSTLEDQDIHSTIHERFGTFEIKICEQQPESVSYVCLSISDDGRFVALSISTEDNGQTKQTKQTNQNGKDEKAEQNNQNGKKETAEQNHQNEEDHQNKQECQNRKKNQTNKESPTGKSQQSEKQHQINVFIYTADTKFKMKKNSWPLNQSITMSKDIKYARPVFTEDKFILATDKGIHMFDFEFQKTSTIGLSYFRQFFSNFSFTLYDSASCNLIDNRTVTWQKNLEIRKRFKYKKRFMDNVGTRSLVTSTEFIRQNVLLENCGSQVVRMWSIESNTLIASIRKELDEKIIAISEKGYFATFNQSKNTINIYSSKTNSRLHEINLFTKQVEENSTGMRGSRININYGSFQFGNNYLFISGYVNKGFGNPHPQNDHRQQEADDEEFTFFELWNIPTQRRVYQKKINGHRLPRRKPIFFITECRITDSLSITYINISHPDRMYWDLSSQFKNDRRNLVKICFNVLTRNKPNATFQNDSETNGWKKWNPNRTLDTIREHWKAKMIGDDIFYMLDHPKPCLKRYLLDSKSGRYVLLFSPSVVQLWRLNSSDEELNRFNQPSFFHLSDMHDIFLMEKDLNESILYKNLIFQNELLYIHHYKKDILIRDEAPEKSKLNQLTMDKIEIEFDAAGCPGRTLIYQKLSENGSLANSNKCKYVYELFLPMEKILQDTPKKNTTEVVSIPYYDPEVTTETLNEKSQRVEFHYFESTIRALYYIESISSEEDEFLVEDMLKSIANLLEKLFQEYEDTDYFATESGSHSLYVLVQSKKYHTLVENVLFKKDMEGDIAKKVCKSTPINLSGPFDPKNTLFNWDDTIKIFGVNIFIALLKQNQILFFLFFHHVLLDSRIRGIGNLVPITDLFLYLQKEKKIDILLKCTEMMAYFPVTKNHAIQAREVQDTFNANYSVKNQKYILPFTLPEKLIRRNYGKRFQFFALGKSSLILKRTEILFNEMRSAFRKNKDIKTYQEPVVLKDFFTSGSKILCMVPLPNFNPHMRQKQNSTGTKPDTFSAITFLDSPFTRISACRKYNDSFVESNVILEVVTTYKWRKFVVQRFFLVSFVHAVYYISFSVGVSFAVEVFDYNPGENTLRAGHITTIAIMFLSWLILCVQEIRQFLNDKLAYVTLYNFIDWTALIIPIASFVLLLKNSEYLSNVTSVATLVLWIHGILRLRAILAFGTTLEFIIQISLRTMPFIGVFCSVVIAFTHTFIVLLRQKEDSYFQEQYSGDLSLTNTGNNSLNQGVVNFVDASSQNNFNNPFKAFFSVWFFIYGAWDTVRDGDAGDDTMIMILLVLFSFIICLIFFNMIIALMSSTIENVKRRGKKNWMHHLAAVVSEVELLWCTSKERLSRINNPNWIYYVADIDSYVNQEKTLREGYQNYLERYNQDREGYQNYLERYNQDREDYSNIF